jgi:hypothetical protein
VREITIIFDCCRPARFFAGRVFQTDELISLILVVSMLLYLAYAIENKKFPDSFPTITIVHLLGDNRSLFFLQNVHDKFEVRWLFYWLISRLQNCTYFSK